ncbi:MAG TPA: hypothetical protein VNQ90_05235 [Chthoniobacteraceae bacterium]|nr:hypothetical protein [Chthoniobacteraceae bacterium]
MSHKLAFVGQTDSVWKRASFMTEGLYNSASGFIRDFVVRHDGHTEKKRWDALYHELKFLMTAPDSDFVLLDAQKILAEAKRRKGAN